MSGCCDWIIGILPYVAAVERETMVPGRRGFAVSLHPLARDQAMVALLRVKLSDVKKVEAKEKKASRNKNRGSR